MNVHHTFSLALQFHRVGRLVEAEALYRQILAVDPRHAETLHLVGAIASSNGPERTCGVADSPGD